MEFSGLGTRTPDDCLPYLGVDSHRKLETALQESLLLMQSNRVYFSLSCYPSLGAAYYLRAKLPPLEQTIMLNYEYLDLPQIQVPHLYLSL